MTVLDFSSKSSYYIRPRIYLHLGSDVLWPQYRIFDQRPKEISGKLKAQRSTSTSTAAASIRYPLSKFRVLFFWTPSERGRSWNIGDERWKAETMKAQVPRIERGRNLWSDLRARTKVVKNMKPLRKDFSTDKLNDLSSIRKEISFIFLYGH